MTPAEKAAAFAAENPKHIDEDGYYGAQCWDVVARYARVKYGAAPFPTGSGGAEGLYRLFDTNQPTPQFFDKKPASEAQAGDIAVFPASFSPPWGHTAVILERNGNALKVFEQNGNYPDGDPYVTTRYVSQLSGVLSPKDKGETMPTSQEVVNQFRRFLGYDPTQEQINIYTSAPWHKLNDDILEEVNRVNNVRKQTIDGLTDALNRSNQTIIALQQQLKDLGNNPTPDQIAALQKSLAEANAKAMAAQAELEKVNAANSKADEQTTGFLRAIWRKIMGN